MNEPTDEAKLEAELTDEQSLSRDCRRMVEGMLAEVGLAAPLWGFYADEPEHLEAFVPERMAIVDEAGDDIFKIYCQALQKAMNLTCDRLGWPGVVDRRTARG